MSNVIVIEFVTLDGIVEDPDGSQGTADGGWAFRHGPETVAGDKFKLGPALERGVLLLGRATWQLFARIWPSRTDEFATAMNRIPKHVASKSLDDVSAWSNSTLLEGNLVPEVQRLARDRDVIVAGSVSLAHQLAVDDLVDEYRLLVFPTVLGRGRRLFPDATKPVNLNFESVEPSGPTVLLRYRKT
jgi:dihydrofolate reductase